MHVSLLQNTPKTGACVENAHKLAQLIQRAEAQCHTEQATLFLCAGYALIGQEWRDIPFSPDLIHMHKQAEEELARLLAEHSSKALVLIRRPQAAAFVLVRAGHKEALPVEDDLLCLPSGQCFHILDFEDYKEKQTCACHSCLPNANLFETRKADTLLILGNLLYAEGQEAALRETLHSLVTAHNVPLVFLNPAGASDGIVYAGSSRILSAEGKLLAFCHNFGAETSTSLELAAITSQSIKAAYREYPSVQEAGLLFEGATLAIQQYTEKCGIGHVVLGLSGGMDSALVACMAVEALGPKHVSAVRMPSPFTSADSMEDAAILAEKLGMHLYTCPIAESMEALKTTLPFPIEGLTGENVQPRLRGLILMAFANQLGGIALATGNKSEIAMGYCTLYGDTVGALAPLGDIYKTRVYDIAHWYNGQKGQEIIPKRVFVKAPTAELRHGQKDEDSLPPYPALDAFLQKLFAPRAVFSPRLISPCSQEPLVLQEYSLNTQDLQSAENALLPPDKAQDVMLRLAKAQFKRRQSPPIVRLSKTFLPDIFSAPISAEYPTYPS